MNILMRFLIKMKYKMQNQQKRARKETKRAKLRKNGKTHNIPAGKDVMQNMKKFIPNCSMGDLL